MKRDEERFGAGFIELLVKGAVNDLKEGLEAGVFDFKSPVEGAEFVKKQVLEILEFYADLRYDRDLRGDHDAPN